MKETLSEYVKRIMRQKNLTLRDIEENSDGEISNSYVSKILNGKAENLEQPIRLLLWLEGLTS